MFRRTLLTALLAANLLSLGAQEVSLFGVVGHNPTYGFHGGTALAARWAVSPAFEADGALQVLTPGVYTLTATARPVFPLPKGQLFLEGALHGALFGRYGSLHYIGAVSAGWRGNYFSGQLGFYTRIMGSLDRSPQSTEEMITEPFNLLYRFAFRLRPSDSRWNAGGGMTNVTRFQFDRAWQPVFFLNGQYGLTERLLLQAQVDFRPTGMFHMTAAWYGLAAYLGVTYRFGL